MVKYYLFSAHNDIDTTHFSDVIRSAYRAQLSLVMLNKTSGYVISDEGFFDVLESLLPLFMADTDNSYTFLMSHNADELSLQAIDKASSRKPTSVTSIGDLLLDLALDGDFDLVALAKKDFARVPRELMQTASTFVSCGLNASLAAKKLYVHRNTFAYRLNRFIDVTNLDIRDYHNAQYFAIATRLINR